MIFKAHVNDDTLQINPHHNHHGGVLDRPDPHKIQDKSSFLAKVELDSEIEELRRKQQNQVLAKPKIIPDDTDSKPAEKSSELTPIENPSSKNDNNNNNNDFKPSDGEVGSNEPKITGGEDSDPAVRAKRDHVKGVNNFLFVYFYARERGSYSWLLCMY